MARGLCALASLIALALAGLGCVEVLWPGSGVPPRHITDYQRAALPAMRILVGLYALLGVYFGWLASARLPLASRLRRLGVGVALLLIVAAGKEMGLPLYFIDHLGLENGWGG